MVGQEVCDGWAGVKAGSDDAQVPWRVRLRGSSIITSYQYRARLLLSSILGIRPFSESRIRSRHHVYFVVVSLYVVIRTKQPRCHCARRLSKAYDDPS
jgi:hypothetical protein